MKPNILTSFIKAQLSRTEDEHLAERLACINILAQELIERSESKYEAEKYRGLARMLHIPSVLNEIKDVGLKNNNIEVAREVLEIMLTLLKPERQLKLKQEQHRKLAKE